MTAQKLASAAGGLVEIDLCFACRGLWFDPLENLKLMPSAVLALFRQLLAPATVEREQYLLEGAHRCLYRITPPAL